MRWLYSILLWVAIPFYFLRLWWRGRKAPMYRERWLERLGFYNHNIKPGGLWIHTVSLGETIAATPLIKALQERLPHLPMTVTTTTPTGSQRVQKTFGATVQHMYLPYDTPTAVHRFLHKVKPCVGILMETELWPNLLQACKAHNIPMVLANARMSQRSAQGYKRIPNLTRDMLQSLELIAAQASADAKRFVALGANEADVHVLGNLKYVMNLPSDLVHKAEMWQTLWGQDRLIWVAASTHAGEEKDLLTVHHHLLKKHPNALLILVPRHPERFKEITELASCSFKTAKRSDNDPNHPATSTLTKDTQVLIGDSMGELMTWFSACDVAFIGGSLIERGGHNPLEPAAVAKPILSGPHIFNFTSVYETLEQADACLITQDIDMLSASLQQLFDDSALRRTMGDAAKDVVNQHQAALSRHLARIIPLCGDKQVDTQAESINA